ncbi:MAG: hypothetical protein CMH54_16180 [Myxococcales bacterium]|nr:hypothetical protein [Myxococcales bacterium]
MTEIGICEPCELKAALAYAKSGWPVVPCHTATKNGGCSCGQISCESPGKHPRYKRGLLEHGLKEATTDEAIITNWWTIWPGANIAVVTGKRSGFDVLDVDLRHGGEDSLSDLEREYGNLPDTVEQLTGGGGRHILFRHQDGLGNKTGLRLGLDVRGEGGYIMAAPSNHASGRKYEWELSSLPGEVDLAEWPEWLLELMEVKNGQLRESAPPVEGEIAAGKRNTTLASLAGSMRQRGMGESAIFAALLIENEQRCKPPLSEAEVRKIATSVAQYEPGQPENGRLFMKVNAGKGQDIHEDISTYPYAIEDGRIGYFKVEKRGDNAGKVFMPLCNFSAQVVEEQVLDNGIDLVRRFAVEGQLADGGGLHRVEITAGQFNGMNWITDQWGVRARWSAGMGAKDRLREGIQIFSANAKLQYTYQHTGWRKINGVWQYLHGGLTDIQVVLEPPLDR